MVTMFKHFGNLPNYDHAFDQFITLHRTSNIYKDIITSLSLRLILIRNEPYEIC